WSLQSTGWRPALLCRLPTLSNPVHLSAHADQLVEPRGVAVFIVVPAHHLHHTILHHLGERRIENAGVGIADDVAGNDGISAVSHDSLQRTLTGLFHGRVYLLHGDIGFQFHGQI